MRHWLASIAAVGLMGGTAVAGEVERHEVHVSWGGPTLGVQVTEITPELRAHFGASEDEGVLVAKVIAGSAAAAAGVAVGDVIVRMGGAAVDDVGDVRQQVHRHAGKQLTLEVVRDGRQRDLSARIEARSDREWPGEGHWRIRGDEDGWRIRRDDGDWRVLDGKDLHPDGLEWLEDLGKDGLFVMPPMQFHGSSPGMTLDLEDLEDTLEQLHDRMEDMAEQLEESFESLQDQVDELDERLDEGQGI